MLASLASLTLYRIASRGEEAGSIHASTVNGDPEAYLASYYIAMSIMMLTYPIRLEHQDLILVLDTKL